MTQEEKLNKILDWYSEINQEETRQLTVQENFQKISEIEKLVGEALPHAIRSLFEKYDGEIGDGYGSFFGHSIISLSEMKNSLDYSKTLVKPTHPKIPDPKSADSLIEQIVKIVIDELPLKKRFGFIKPKWHKVAFESGPGSIGGPYFYPTEDTPDRERIIVKLSNESRNKIINITKELHKKEIQDYNWDKLKIVAYRDGQHTVDRTFYDLENTLPLTSAPEGAIKKKYFHIKWIPLIADYGGNYIGIDLDPDKNGVKGQVIIFGRDEEDMIVLADSWDEFLDWNLNLIEEGGDKLKEGIHLHDLYRKIKTT